MQEGGGETKECAIKEKATIFNYKPNQKQKNDLLLTLKGKKDLVIKRLQNQIQRHRGIKWYLCSKVQLLKSNPDGTEQKSTPHFRSLCMTTTNPSELRDQYEDAVEKVKSSFLEYQKEGSGWQLDEVISIKFSFVTQHLKIFTIILSHLS